MRISAMVLVGENEPYLKYCIESIKDLVDEIVFLLSPTVQGNFKSEYKDEKFKFIWQTAENKYETDFASWRNQALKECTGDYVLWLDADEILAKPNGENCSRELLEQILSNNKDIYHFFTFHFLYDYRTIDGRNDGLHFSQTRLFRNDGNNRFEGKIHEYLTRPEAEEEEPNKYTRVWCRPTQNFGVVNNPCIWHFGGCKGMEDVRKKYAMQRDIKGNPFAEEFKRYKDNDEYCSHHPLFIKVRPLISYQGPLPKVMKLW